MCDAGGIFNQISPSGNLFGLLLIAFHSPPFSDLTRAKRRRAFVVQYFNGEDILLAQITSQKVRDEYAIALENDDFNTGSLNKPSNIRPNKIFTCSRNIILYRVGSLKTKSRIRPGRYFFYY